MDYLHFLQSVLSKAINFTNEWEKPWLLSFLALPLRYIHLTYLLALKKAAKHCDFTSTIKIFRFIPVTETDTITDAAICVCVICSSCDFPVLHLMVIYSMVECMRDTQIRKFTFTLFWKVIRDLVKYKCRSELVLSLIYLLHWQGVFGWLLRS